MSLPLIETSVKHNRLRARRKKHGGRTRRKQAHNRIFTREKNTESENCKQTGTVPIAEESTNL